jgi:hypothetical protein
MTATDVREPVVRRSGASGPPSSGRSARGSSVRHRAHGPSPEQSAALGKAARAATPRSSHADHTPGPHRADPVDVLVRDGAGRVEELLPLRYGRMVGSALAFLRGGAAVMAADLADSPTTGFTVQLCGDAHLANFGMYASPERRLVFDVNDFDETERGPWEWDVKRLAASLQVAARGRSTSAESRGVVLAAGAAYRSAMRRFAGMRHLDLWYERVDLDDPATLAGLQLDATARRRAARAVQKAHTRGHDRAVRRLTERHGGGCRIASAPPLVEPLRDLLPPSGREDLEHRLDRILRAYRRSLSPDRRWLVEQYRLVDVARRVGGVGSVGTRCWVVLLRGRDENDLLLLQMKEARPSALTPYAHPRPQRDGRRVVLGQRHVQAVTDIFLGWHRSAGLDGVHRDFYVRQLADWKGSADVERMRARDLLRYGELCARTLARGHARTGDRFAIAGYLGASDRFDVALADFAAAYADQNARDHDRLRQAVASGRVQADTERS